MICHICKEREATHTVTNTTPASKYHSKDRSKVDRSDWLFCDECLETMKPGQNALSKTVYTVKKIGG